MARTALASYVKRDSQTAKLYFYKKLQFYMRVKFLQNLVYKMLGRLSKKPCQLKLSLGYPTVLPHSRLGSN